MITVVNKYKHTPTENDVYIGRGSALGNPFTSIKDKVTRAEFICESREESVERFKEYLLLKISQKDKKICDELNKIYKMTEVNLVCFCKPKSCHGDIIKGIISAKKLKKMRNYRIYYYAEINDECVDLKETLQAYSLSDAIIKFENSGIVHKRIYKTEEF
jgi:hypothetical protein